MRIKLSVFFFIFLWEVSFCSSFSAEYNPDNTANSIINCQDLVFKKSDNLAENENLSSKTHYSHASPSPESPLFNLIIKKGEGESGKDHISFKCDARDILWRNKKINLTLQGGLKKNEQFCIIEITAGDISFGSLSREEFSSYVVYKDNLLTVTYFKTKSFILKGTVNLTQPAFLNLDIDIKGISLEDLNRLWGIENFPFRGDFRGKLALKGDINNIFIKGMLEAYKGNLEDYKFDNVFFNFRGTYPWIQFYDSYAVIKDMNLDVEGVFNLAKLYALPYNNEDNGNRESNRTGLTDNNNGQTQEANSIEGFLTLSKESNSFIYKFGTDSFLRLHIKEPDLPTPTKLEF